MKDLIYESRSSFTVPRRETIKKYNAKAKVLASAAGRQPVRAAVMKALVFKVKDRVFEMERKRRIAMGFGHVVVRRRPLPVQSEDEPLRKRVLIRQALKQPIPKHMLTEENWEKKLELLDRLLGR